MIRYLCKQITETYIIYTKTENTMEQKQSTTISLREAERQLAHEVEQLLNNHHEEEGLQWKGTCIDLMEALHTAFTSGLITDDEGQYLSFTAIVGRACRLLHVRQPRNPYECAARGRRRKGFQRRPFIERYHLRLCRRGGEPLGEFINW
jgi:hypothetical protein